jgi:ABC-type multidrug transport system ATPase subunit
MELCPAGFVCEVPWEKKQCEPGEWCPEGSQIRQTCPAGRVCRTPATNDICPGGYFCPTNTWEPRKCSPLALCTEGSSAQRGWLALSLEFAVLAIVLVIYYVVHRVRATRRKARVEAALKQRKANNRFLLRSEESEMEVDYDNEDALLLLSDSDISDVESIPSPRTSSTRIPGPGPVVSERPSIDIEFNDIELKVSGGKKTVLQRVSGRFKPGQLSAVMGPSGAGKSSLLSVLSGESTKSAGEILINGTPDSLTRFKSVIGFVPQEDIMHRTLSVVEILRFNAAMRLPRGVRESEREDLVEDILDILNLKKVKYSLIGDENKRGLSGGERKRVNIGMELAADPSVLFLDEPTSGLDSSSAVQVCKCLKTIAARSNMTIVCVIHQPRPEVFQLFDSVLFLAPGGRTVFQGGVDEASAYFGEIGYPVPAMSNPADFYMDVIYACATGDAGSLDIELKNLPEEWKQRIEDVKVEEVPRAESIATMGSKKSKFSPRLTADFFTQLWHFFLRSCVLQMRDLRSILLNIFLVFISGLLLGFVYADASYIGPPSAAKRSMCPDFIASLCDMPQEDTYVLQFALMNMALGLTAVAGALPTFGDERVQFWRESRTGLNSLAFFLGKNLAGIPMIIIPPLFLLSIFYFLTTPGAGFFQMYAVLLVVQFTCVAVGYLISLLMAPANALLAGVVFVIVSTMFSGANPTLAKLKGFGVPGMIMTSISFSRWANEALYSSLLVTYQVQYDIEPGLRYWGYEIANYPVIDFLALGGLALFLRIVAYLVLFFVHRNKKI